MSEERIFEHAATFEAGELSGHVQVDRFEAYYEQLFADVLEDGVITADERVELERAASALGLDPERLRRLEQALLVSYETRHKVRVREEIAPGDELRPSLRGTDVDRDAYISTLERRVKIDRLRGAFLRFVEEGGRTNWQRWASAVERTTARAGFLLADDLNVADRMLTLENAQDAPAMMDDLVVFSTGDRCGALRKRLGIAAGL